MADEPQSNLGPRHRKVPVRILDERSDGELLYRFLSRGMEADFRALVERHGPMVLALCRRLLGDPHDAEDAFQATFLVLIHKAPSIGEPDLLGNWLYGVACRIAAKAKSARGRRRSRERQGVPMSTQDKIGVSPGRESQPGLDMELQRRELRAVLDEELERLPPKYRTPIVLCYLEGKTYTDVAKQLGWAAGTVSGRLARARELLRKRLTRRGLALDTDRLVGEIAQVAAPAAMPAPLVLATAQAALTGDPNLAVAAGLVSAQAAALTKGMVNNMGITWIKPVLVGLVLASGGMGTYAFLNRAPNEAAETGEKAKVGTARHAVEAYVAAALAGEIKEAAKHAEPGKSHDREKNIREMGDLLRGQEVGIDSVHVTAAKALVVTKSVRINTPNPDGRDTGRLLFTLISKDKRWLIHDIDFDDEAKAKKKTDEFIQKSPDAAAE